CTLYHLLTGAPPFAGPAHVTPHQKIRAHAEEPPPPLAGGRPDLPAGLTELVSRLLAKAPADRPASARDVAAALKPFAADSELIALARAAGPATGAAADTGTVAMTADDSSRAVRQRPRGRRWRKLIGAGLAATVIVAIVAAFGFLARTAVLDIRDDG